MSEILSKEELERTLNALPPWAEDYTGKVLTIPEWIAESMRIFNRHEALRAKVADYEGRGMGKLKGWRIERVIRGAAGGSTMALLAPVEKPTHHRDTEGTEKGGGG